MNFKELLYKHLRFSDYGSEQFVARWLTALSIPDAPVRRESVRTALQFFYQSRKKMKLDVKTALSYIRAMDTSRLVSVVQLPLESEVVGYRRGEYRYGNFYTQRGQSITALGIDPDGRTFVRYRVKVPSAWALKSYLTGARDDWTTPGKSYLATGRGVQLIIPDSENVLEITQDNKDTDS